MREWSQGCWHTLLNKRLITIISWGLSLREVKEEEFHGVSLPVTAGCLPNAAYMLALVRRSYL